LAGRRKEGVSGGNGMKKKHRIFREIGRVAVNFGNLTFASLVLGSIIKGDYDKLAILLVGGCVVVLLITSGIVLLTIGGEE